VQQNAGDPTCTYPASVVPLMARDAVLADTGPALLPKLLGADDIAAGRLV
jgi:hypothetical protein